MTVQFNLPVTSVYNCLFSLTCHVAGNKNSEICISKSHSGRNRYIGDFVVTMAMQRQDRARCFHCVGALGCALDSRRVVPQNQLVAKEHFPPRLQQVPNQDGFGEAFSLFLRSAMSLCAYLQRMEGLGVVTRFSFPSCLSLP